MIPSNMNVVIDAVHNVMALAFSHHDHRARPVNRRTCENAPMLASADTVAVTAAPIAYVDRCGNGVINTCAATPTVTASTTPRANDAFRTFEHRQSDWPG